MVSEYNERKLVVNRMIMKNINVEIFKKDGFSYQEIESVKRGLDDIEQGRVVSYEDVKKSLRKKLLSKQELNV